MVLSPLQAGGTRFNKCGCKGFFHKRAPSINVRRPPQPSAAKPLSNLRTLGAIAPSNFRTLKPQRGLSIGRQPSGILESTAQVPIPIPTAPPPPPKCRKRQSPYEPCLFLHSERTCRASDYNSLPTIGASCFSRPMRSSKVSGVMDSAPSHHACSGSL